MDKILEWKLASSVIAVLLFILVVSAYLEFGILSVLYTLFAGAFGVCIGVWMSAISEAEEKIEDVE